MKNNLKLCKTCGATIAKNAKRCPKCGAKNKKSIYKHVWFWILVVVAVLFVSSKISALSNNEELEKIDNTLTETVQEQETPTPISTEEEALIGQWCAIKLFKLEDMKSGDMDAKESVSKNVVCNRAQTIQERLKVRREEQHRLSGATTIQRIKAI